MDVSIQIKCCKSCNYHYTSGTTYKTYAQRCEQLPARVIMHSLKEFRFPRAGFISPNFSYLRAQCWLPANCVGSFLGAEEGEGLLQRLQLWLPDEDCVEGPISCRGQAACWARHGWLPAGFNLIAGNSVFQNRNGWSRCCNIWGMCVKSWEGRF